MHLFLLQTTVFSRFVNLIYAIYLAISMLLLPDPAYVTSAKTDRATLEIQGKQLTVSVDSDASAYRYWRYNVISGDEDVLSLQEIRFVPENPVHPNGNGQALYTFHIERCGVISGLCYADIARDGARETMECQTVSFTVSVTITGKAYLSDVRERNSHSYSLDIIS